MDGCRSCTFAPVKVPPAEHDRIATTMIHVAGVMTKGLRDTRVRPVLVPPRATSAMLQTKLVSTPAWVPVHSTAPIPRLSVLGSASQKFQAYFKRRQKLGNEAAEHGLPRLPRVCLHGFEALGMASQKFQPHPKPPHGLGGVELVHCTQKGFLYMLRCIKALGGSLLQFSSPVTPFTSNHLLKHYQSPATFC